ncbi:5-(carboxyamino)imidazole ribonucleotide synthase [Acidimicrobiia bacterium EGI L10123]|uniref:5-(carboxyamino)imidazole ribonucleotide synthase n=1 Tax=Salinilacustrithrix flava TaxID=2957203 RepID=UPI003D7C3078|nr:5-(carboxyamino)imidazole ribonucleotide synthase [Acidimicrobiia bacterium EGI L10123]
MEQPADRDFPVVGIIGGGQLARMCQPPAVAMSITLSVLAASEGDSAALVIPDALVGAHDDLDAVRRLAKRCDVVTFDHEHVPPDVLAALADDGIPLHPTPAALRFAQDKVAMRRRLSDLGFPCPRWTVARTADEVAAFGADVGWPIIAKTPRGGYDGKGVRRVDEADELGDWLAVVGEAGPLVDGVLLEESVPFDREVAALVARNPSGSTAAWPLVETVQEDGICTEVLAPAPGLEPAAARAASDLAVRIADALGVTGVLAVELFEVADAIGQPTFLVNELAMRPHNSGHWTIDGAVTSQFEQHLRAVLDLPLGDTAPRSRWTVMANVLGGSREDLYPEVGRILGQDPSLRVHLYGKQVRPGRKIGHVTVCGEDLRDLRLRARRAADQLRGAPGR